MMSSPKLVWLPATTLSTIATANGPIAAGNEAEPAGTFDASTAA
jgi:hypothetical protein